MWRKTFDLSFLLLMSRVQPVQFFPAPSSLQGRLKAKPDKTVPEPWEKKARQFQIFPQAQIPKILRLL